MRKNRLVMLLLLCMLSGCVDFAGVQQEARDQAQSDREHSIKAPFAIDDAGYVPSGYMGDGEYGRRYIRMSYRDCQPPPSSDVTNCYEVSYSPGPIRWAGVYWQTPADNWGNMPGKRIVGASRIKFWARGAKGREVVEFKAGGIKARRKFGDSFEATLGRVYLRKEWREYEIPLDGKDLSSVIGAFAWVSAGDFNTGGVVFYLAHISYE